MMVEQLPTVGTWSLSFSGRTCGRGTPASAGGRRLAAVTPASTLVQLRTGVPRARAAAVYGYVRLARTVEQPSFWRATLFGLGVALIAVPLDSPLETIAVHYLLVIHLLQNVMVADWAPPLLILGLTPAMRDRVAALGGRPLAL